MTTEPESTSDGRMGWRFYASLLGVIIVISLASLGVLALFGYAWYAWGLVGAMVATGVVAIVIASIMDRRNSTHRAG